ncbi:MAG: imidazolonepropionase [Bacteriovoracaceae bacterium]
MKIYKNISELVTLKGAHQKDGRRLAPEDLDIIEDGAIAFDQDQILWTGETKNIPREYKSFEAQDFSGKTLTPELVDSHTHIVFGGNRSKEYLMRLNGADYQEIAKAGGGILHTMDKTNESSMQQLHDSAVQRIQRLNSLGIGTIEIKSGYGLNIDKEREISLLIDNLKKHFSPKIQIKNTFMAAHAVPQKYKSSSDYLEQEVIPLLKELAPMRIIDAVDIFFERGYFSHSDTEDLFNVCSELGIPYKLHADEFYDNKGALLGAHKNALSADHLLCTDIDGIKALANSNTVATLLPGTGLFLGKPQANARAFLDQGVKVAIGSDYNPGSCHFDNLLLIASIAAPIYNMNVAELFSSITLNASHALGIKDQGALVKGLKPRFTVFDCPTLAEVFYNWGQNFALPC